jgi:hypothetical protein
MKYIIKLNLTLYIFLSLSTNAQNSVVTSGKDEGGIYGNLSYTIGEVFYTLKGNGYNLSEGPQQPFKINPVLNRSSLHVSVYPNPSRDFIYFLVEDLNFNNLNYELISISGKVLLSGKITTTKSFVPLNNILNGVYLLKISRGAFEKTTYQILKIK